MYFFKYVTMVARHQKVKKSSMDTEDKVTRKLKFQSAYMVQSHLFY